MLPRAQTRVSRPVHQPPATSTRPLGRRVAVSLARAVCIEPVAAHVPVAGLYSSALATGRPVTSPPMIPPATSTLPSWSSVAVAPVTAKGMLPVGENVRVAGLYSSAVAVPPPATSTLPPGSRVAVWPEWASRIEPVGTQVFGGPSPRPAALAAGARGTRLRPATATPAAAAAATGLWQARSSDITVPPGASQPVTVNVAFGPAKLHWPCAAIWWAPAVALGIVTVVVNVPVLVVVGRPRITALSQNSATRSPASKPLPDTVTFVPAGPLAGCTDIRTGVNSSAVPVPAP